MIKLPLVNLSITLNNLSNDILTTQLSDEDIGTFLGLLKVGEGELVIIDLIRCIILSSIERKDLIPMDINYFSPNCIDIIKGDCYEYSISITETFLDLENLIGKKDKDYVMYIHSLFTLYGLNSCINKYRDNIYNNDLVRQEGFWKDFNAFTYNVEKTIQNMEMKYPRDISDKITIN